MPRHDMACLCHATAWHPRHAAAARAHAGALWRMAAYGAAPLREVAQARVHSHSVACGTWSVMHWRRLP
jgi:hypothetical protein